MAYVSSDRTAGLNLAGSFLNVIAMIKTAIERRAVYVRTRNELEALSDRELSDLGLSRFNIASIAYEAAYGN